MHRLQVAHGWQVNHHWSILLPRLHKMCHLHWQFHNLSGNEHLRKEDYILLGNFNIKVNILDNPKASTFKDFLSCLGFKNHTLFCSTMPWIQMISSLQMRYQQSLLVSDKENSFRIITLFTSTFYISDQVENLMLQNSRKLRILVPTLLTQISWNLWIMVMKYLILKGMVNHHNRSHYNVFDKMCHQKQQPWYKEYQKFD